eukprot:CAMPEP_0197536182 /NCGR_PEP_ID=MMETSP1318-20131121/53192_1 /TAXON_ID=552666 /ORGANISM="Partenskyella glossopodia, Strain RCC365" /LENGTH=144 /DNA_ID=CAMNT_0043094003 /DNA_START=75 /DNA_END=509 /DNA_ORIENTATION=-
MEEMLKSANKCALFVMVFNILVFIILIVLWGLSDEICPDGIHGKNCKTSLLVVALVNVGFAILNCIFLSCRWDTEREARADKQDAKDEALHHPHDKAGEAGITVSHGHRIDLEMKAKYDEMQKKAHNKEEEAGAMDEAAAQENV